MASEVLLPKQGNSVESCIILEWKKNEGDTVAMGEPILEVETDKATFEVESTAEGVLLSRLVAEGDDVPVLAPVAIVGEAGEKPVASAPAAAVSGGERATTPGTAAPAVESSPQTGASAPGAALPEAIPRGRDGRRAISPRARRLAAEKDVDYSGIAGSGPGGRIMVRDVETALASGTAKPVSDVTAAATAAPDTAAVEEIKVTGVRKIIAERMRQSLATTAQLTMNSGADARTILAYRAKLKASTSEDLQAVSLNDILMFAVTRALAEFPALNATFSNGVITRHRAVNLGFAVDTDRGLMVPVIRNAGSLSLVELAAEAHRLAGVCKAAKAKPEDLEGATFSVTNLGVYGVQSFTPVLDPPQVGILGVGSVEPKPVVSDGNTSFVPTIGLSLTIDHQVVDGAPGARFLAGLAQKIAHFDITLAQ